MNCPVCNSVLQLTQREGIEIDFCPKCRGIWLDRGELDKIIERSTVTHYNDDDSGEFPAPNGHTHHRPSYQAGHRKKRESFWSRMFDFD